jgi:CspA family cold shock protein
MKNQPQPAARTDDRIEGRIKRLVRDRGFGFCVDLGGAEFFFHRTAVEDFEALNEGEAITFIPTNGPKGRRAEQVQTANAF